MTSEKELEALDARIGSFSKYLSDYEEKFEIITDKLLTKHMETGEKCLTAEIYGSAEAREALKSAIARLDEAAVALSVIEEDDRISKQVEVFRGDLSRLRELLCGLAVLQRSKMQVESSDEATFSTSSCS
ncbi:unnamed protein product [Caenorhabditis auriculariae]|uniref:Uncharacterized protein n=1 Tax=Caenorhabditis auriculariae TaxID=2777116 RepID=A0A8S1GRZ0_9PELO|nr:unnamed protein product [Caenorhabditis auriculariae]